MNTASWGVLLILLIVVLPFMLVYYLMSDPPGPFEVFTGQDFETRVGCNPRSQEYLILGRCVWVTALLLTVATSAMIVIPIVEEFFIPRMAKSSRRL